MAASRHRKTTAYNTYGSVAYAPAYDGSAVRAPRREEDFRRQPVPRHKQREKALTRTQVQVREAGAVSPFAVIGFLAVGIFAALLLISYTQFTVLNDQVISMRNELNTLQTESVSLSAQYEKVFDMERIQLAIGDTMIRPTTDQVVYLDLATPDSVVLYQAEEATGGIAGAIDGVQSVVSELVAYIN